jgi:hypothetical protein
VVSGVGPRRCECLIFWATADAAPSGGKGTPGTI